jgi:hypothetical protein
MISKMAFVGDIKSSAFGCYSAGGGVFHLYGTSKFNIYKKARY